MTACISWFATHSVPHLTQWNTSARSLAQNECSHLCHGKFIHSQRFTAPLAACLARTADSTAFHPRPRSQLAWLRKYSMLVRSFVRTSEPCSCSKHTEILRSFRLSSVRPSPGSNGRTLRLESFLFPSGNLHRILSSYVFLSSLNVPDDRATSLAEHARVVPIRRHQKPVVPDFEPYAMAEQPAQKPLHHAPRRFSRLASGDRSAGLKSSATTTVSPSATRTSSSVMHRCQWSGYAACIAFSLSVSWRSDGGLSGSLNSRNAGSPVLIFLAR